MLLIALFLIEEQQTNGEAGESSSMRRLTPSNVATPAASSSAESSRFVRSSALMPTMFSILCAPNSFVLNATTFLPLCMRSKVVGRP